MKFEVKDIGTFGTEDGMIVAIACGKTHYGNNHTGLLMKMDSETEMFHFGWHNSLSCDSDLTFFEKLCWVDFDYFNNDNDPDNLKKQVLNRFAYSVFEECKNNIPYGINYFGDYFDIGDSKLHLTSATVGLTCATFLVAFFKGYGLELIDYPSWPSRPDDKLMQARIVGMMKATGVPLEHIEQVANEEVASRYQPEEITASSVNENLPAGFTFCEAFGADINAVIHA